MIRTPPSRQQTDAEFAEFVQGSQRRLLHFAWLLTNDHHRGEELVQDALVRTYAAWSRVRRADSFAYARRALVNARIDGFRRRRRERLVDAVPEHGGGGFENAVADRAHIAAALQVLTARERRVVVLRYYLDMAEHDVAAELSVTVGTVKSTASRALAKLRVHSAQGDALAARKSGANGAVPSLLGEL